MKLSFNHAFAGACIVLAGGLFFVGPQPDPTFTFERGTGSVTPEGGIVATFNGNGHNCTLQLDPRQDIAIQTCQRQPETGSTVEFMQRDLSSLSASEWDALTEVTEPACQAAAKRAGYNKVCDLNPQSLRRLSLSGLV